MDDILCGGGSDLICVVRGSEREKRRGKNNFMAVGTKGVLITSGLGITKWRREIAQTSDFVDNFEVKVVWSEITSALHDGSVVTRHKQHVDDRAHNI